MQHSCLAGDRSLLPAAAGRGARRAFLLGLLVLLAVGLAQPRPRPLYAQTPPRELVIGALLALSGDGQSLGLASQAALAVAATDINAEFAAAGTALRVRIDVEDTGQVPERALAAVQRLAARGVRVVVGPQTSSEVRAISAWVNANGVLVLSQGSTASSLSQRQDNVLRFVPDDTHETAAIAALMEQDGIQAVVPLWRDDAGNNGLHASFLTAFPNAVDTVAAGGRYAPDTTDFSSTVASLSDQVRAVAATSAPGSVAVFLASFEEAVQIFQLAAADPVLAGVRWYGTDGVASSAAVLADPAASAFALQSGFVAPDLGLPPAERAQWQRVADLVAAQVGFAPNAYALTAYDIAWVTALAALETTSTQDASVLRTALVNTANRYHGITGDTMLNAAGDRSSGSYTFVAVQQTDAGPAWVPVATYVPGSGVSPTGP